MMGYENIFTPFFKHVAEEKRVCCIRGHHVYKEIWEAAAGEVLVYEREPHNALDRTARCLPKPFSLVTSASLFARANCL